MGKLQKGFCSPAKVVLAVLVLGFVFIIGSSPAWADAPKGSYRQTCKSIRYNADRITSASCQKISGSWKTTQFNNPQQCISQGGDISNCDGIIQCTGVNLPNVGSYKRSCFCCRMAGTRLSCYCKPKKGISRFTTLSNASGYTDIWNDDGRLKGK
jgi:hypothetical protein